MNKNRIESRTRLSAKVLFLDYPNGYLYGRMWFAIVPCCVLESDICNTILMKRTKESSAKQMKAIRAPYIYSVSYRALAFLIILASHLFIIFRFDHFSYVFWHGMHFHVSRFCSLYLPNSDSDSHPSLLFSFTFSRRFAFLSITTLWPMAVMDVLELPSHCFVSYFSFARWHLTVAAVCLLFYHCWLKQIEGQGGVRKMERQKAESESEWEREREKSQDKLQIRSL